MPKTKILKMSNKSIETAVKTLKKGKIIIYPTESSYGIGCDATNLRACKKIFSLKKRTKTKSLPFIVFDIKTAEKYGKLTKLDKKLIKKFMPGPLTLIVEKKYKKISNIVNKDFVFRIPENKWARLLAKKLKKPVVSTSANISGKKPVFKIIKIIEQFNNKVDIILDGGNLPENKPSTILKNNKIIRKGAVSKKELKKIFNFHLF